MKILRKRKDLTQFFQYVLRLKYVKRAGWISKVKVQNAESVADHTFSMCAVSMVLSDILRLDTERVMKMVILHDLAESIIGDYMPGEIPKKQKILKEKKAMNYILYCIPSNIRPNYKKIWHEYLQNKTDVAQLVHRIDKFEMLLQANQYAKEGYSKKSLAQFFNSVKRHADDEKQNIWFDGPKRFKANPLKNTNIMQYFSALKIGERRVKAAQELLTTYTGYAMPALALKDNKDNKWEPVGEENLFAVIKETNGYMIAFCDKNGIAKSIAQWFTEEKKDEIIAKIKMEHDMKEYFGKLSLPI